MMSRRNTLPSLSSSRQMMMAWKVSGLSHRPAIMASRPASMRFAIAISPSRDNSSTEPISRRYMRTGSSVRSPGSDFLVSAGVERCISMSSPSLSSPSGSVLRRLLGFGFLRFDDVDPHLAEHHQDVLDLLGLDLLRGQQRVDLVVGDVAALLGAADQLLDGVVPEVNRRAVGRGLGTVLLQNLFLLFRRIGLACSTPERRDELAPLHSITSSGLAAFA